MTPYQMTPAQRSAYCGQLVESMRHMVYEPATSKPWTPDHKKYINDIAQSVRITGGETAPEI